MGLLITAHEGHSYRPIWFGLRPSQRAFGPDPECTGPLDPLKAVLPGNPGAGLVTWLFGQMANSLFGSCGPLDPNGLNGLWVRLETTAIIRASLRPQTWILAHGKDTLMRSAISGPPSWKASPAGSAELEEEPLCATRGGKCLTGPPVGGKGVPVWAHYGGNEC